MEKSVDQRIKECKEVIIQNMEKTLQHKMVYMYLKDKKIESNIKQFSVNGKDGIIKIQFNEHEKAEKFYDESNFLEKILLRPFNIYFNLQLSEDEMKKFYLEGITEENQRKLFEECRKLGFCKLYTSYSTGPRGKIKPNGVLSFIRKENITEDQEKNLSEALKGLGIKLSAYVHEKGLRCSINIINFFEGDLTKDQNDIQIAAENQVKELIKNVVKSDPSNISIIVKKREANVEKDIAAKTFVTALLEFPDVDSTMDNFELLREHFVNLKETKAILFFHNEENNSYVSLFTNGLSKPKDLTEKQFEKKLLEDFKKVNANVIQVNIYQVKFNESYIGRVYLKNEIDGKNFIVDYVARRGDIYQNYLDKNFISFNINIDLKTLRKIKNAEKKAGDIAGSIKKQAEIAKREQRRPINNMQIANYPNNFPPQMGGNIVMPPNLQGMQPQIGVMGSQMPMTGGYPPMGAMGGYGAMNLGGMGGMQGMGGMGGMGGNKIAPPQPIQPQNPRQKISSMLRDRANFETMDITRVKKFAFESLKFLVEENGVPTAESGSLANNILNECDSIAMVFRYLESTEELKKRINH